MIPCACLSNSVTVHNQKPQTSTEAKKKKKEGLKWFYFFSPFNFKLSLELHSFFSRAWSKAHWIQRKDSSASISWEKAHNTPYAKYESIHLSLIHILLLLCALQQGISFLRDEACKGVAGGISKQRFLSTWAPRSAGTHPPSQQCCCECLTAFGVHLHSCAETEQSTVTYRLRPLLAFGLPVSL